MEKFMTEVRLGDVIDDFCIKCRRLTNHSIVSILDAKAAKVRCRTCYNDHDYRFEQAPPSKKELKKAELLLASMTSGEGVEVPDGIEEPIEAAAVEALVLEVEASEAEPAEVEPVEVEVAAPAAKKGRGRAKKA